jgi:prolyl oligopeptidase
MGRRLGLFCGCDSGGNCGESSQTIHGREGISLPAPPAVDTDPVTDDYFGTKIVDNYRWLEDGKSPRRELLSMPRTPTRALHEAGEHPAAGGGRSGRAGECFRGRVPLQRGESYFFRKRLAGEQQFSIYVRHGWARAKDSGWSIRRF